MTKIKDNFVETLETFYINVSSGNSLSIQGLGLSAFTTGLSSIPGQETKILQATQ